MMRWVLAVGLLAFVGLLGCGGREVRLYAAPTTLPSGVHVRVQQAKFANDRLYVDLYMQNATNAPMTIDRDGFQLRLPSGEVLQRSVGTFTRHNVYTLAPGMGRDVNVDFKSEDIPLDQIPGAWLIVGGIGFGSDPMPRVAGEVLLTTTPQPGVMAAPVPPPGAPPAESAPAEVPPEAGATSM